MKHLSACLPGLGRGHRHDEGVRAQPRRRARPGVPLQAADRLRGRALALPHRRRRQPTLTPLLNEGTIRPLDGYVAQMGPAPVRKPADPRRRADHGHRHDGQRAAPDVPHRRARRARPSRLPTTYGRGARRRREKIPRRRGWSSKTRSAPLPNCVVRLDQSGGRTSNQHVPPGFGGEFFDESGMTLIDGEAGVKALETMKGR